MWTLRVFQTIWGVCALFDVLRERSSGDDLDEEAESIHPPERGRTDKCPPTHRPRHRGQSCGTLPLATRIPKSPLPTPTLTYRRPDERPSAQLYTCLLHPSPPISLSFRHGFPSNISSKWLLLLLLLLLWRTKDEKLQQTLCVCKFSVLITFFRLSSLLLLLLLLLGRRGGSIGKASDSGFYDISDPSSHPWGAQEKGVSFEGSKILCWLAVGVPNPLAGIYKNDHVRTLKIL